MQRIFGGYWPQRCLVGRSSCNFHAPTHIMTILHYSPLGGLHDFFVHIPTTYIYVYTIDLSHKHVQVGQCYYCPWAIVNLEINYLNRKTLRHNLFVIILRLVCSCLNVYILYFFTKNTFLLQVSCKLIIKNYSFSVWWVSILNFWVDSCFRLFIRLEKFQLVIS